MKLVNHSIILAVVLAAAACSKKEEPAPVTTMAAAEPAPMAMPSASGAHEGHDMPKAPSVEYAAPTVQGKVFFVGTKDGDTVKGPEADGKIAVMVKMGVEGLTIKPAGALEAGTGHHHIVIDAPGVAEGTDGSNAATHARRALPDAPARGRFPPLLRSDLVLDDQDQGGQAVTSRARSVRG
jgi:hypothetical protein